MNKRYAYLDFLRCLAIFFVVILHVMSPVLTNTGLYGSTSWYICLFQNSLNRAGVPLFLMISGFLMLRDERTRDVGGFYKKRLPRLLLPLAVWNGIYYVVYALRDGEPLNPVTYLRQLLNNGSAYHFWFVYTLLGIYLIAPFLKRIVDAAGVKEQIILLLIVMFPGAIRPWLNMAGPIYIFLFDPLMESYLGYFLLGYLLGSQSLSKKLRVGVYLGGVAGFLIGSVGNLVTASPEGIPVPFNMAYGMNHYLCAGAIFVLVKTFFEKHEAGLTRLDKPLAALSGLVFGVYWVHVAVLELVSRFLPGGTSLALLLVEESVLTLVFSVGIAWVISKIPGVRKCLM
ncbi:MAG: acyltransferase family protein [Oscillospiraceae bacterium]|nr:acyltransferase family protein [Oscillospiraceae bacterium]